MGSHRMVNSKTNPAMSMSDSDDVEKGHKANYAVEETDESGCCDVFLVVLAWLLVIITMPFSLCVCFKTVQQYERAVIFRLGRSTGAKGPGLFFILPCIDSIQIVDLRTLSFDIPPQEVLTKDHVTIQVDGVVYFRVVNPTYSVTRINNAKNATYLLASTTLRDVLGQRTLTSVLADREVISKIMQKDLDRATDPWGIYVERVEIKDVKLPHQMQRAMAAEAEASRDAQAKIIAAKGELDASKALKQAADVMTENGGALQLRYLQTLTQISAEKNSTIIFPLPLDLMPGSRKKNL